MTNEALLHIWSQLQKAESDLMGAIRSRNPDIGRMILGDFDLSSYDFMLFFRLVSGFDIHHLSADSYLQRYPFSSIEAIEKKLMHFTSLGYLTSGEAGAYQLTEMGKRIPHHYWAHIDVETARLSLDNVSAAHLELPFRVLQDILTAIQIAEHPSGMVIFNQRMQGLHPDYDPPALWHLWQYVWSMLAFEEDIRWWRGRQLGIIPLPWHYFWELRREGQTLEGLHRRTLRYAPVSQLEGASQKAIEDLHQHGWVETDDASEGTLYVLSELGQRTADFEETGIDSEFLSVWPDLSSAELEGIGGFLMRLNHELERIISTG